MPYSRTRRRCVREKTVIFIVVLNERAYVHIVIFTYNSMAVGTVQIIIIPPRAFSNEPTP